MDSGSCGCSILSPLIADRMVVVHSSSRCHSERSESAGRTNAVEEPLIYDVARLGAFLIDVAVTVDRLPKTGIHWYVDSNCAKQQDRVRQPLDAQLRRFPFWNNAVVFLLNFLGVSECAAYNSYEEEGEVSARLPPPSKARSSGSRPHPRFYIPSAATPTSRLDTRPIAKISS